MIYPKALTDEIRHEYFKYKGSYRAKRIDYYHDEVLFIKGNPGAGKTAGALAHCGLYPNTLYFSFKNFDASLAPRIFAAQYPNEFQPCETWEDFFGQLYDYGIKKHGVIFFDDAGTRNDKDEFIQQLQRILEKNKRYSFFVVFLLKPWESLPLRAKEGTVKPISPAELRRVFKLKDEDTFRLYTLTGGNPHLLSQYDVNLPFEENVRKWMRQDSHYYRFAQDWMAYCFRSPESYNTLLYGVATGRSRVAELSDLSGFPNNKVDKYLILFSIRITTFNSNSVSDGHDHIRSELINGQTQSIQDMVQSFKDFVSESHSAKLFPDLFYGIHLWSVRRDMQ